MLLLLLLLLLLRVRVHAHPAGARWGPARLRGVCRPPPASHEAMNPIRALARRVPRQIMAEKEEVEGQEGGGGDKAGGGLGCG